MNRSEADVNHPGLQRRERKLFGDNGQAHLLDVPFLQGPEVKSTAVTSLAMMLGYLGKKHSLKNYAEYTPEFIAQKVHSHERRSDAPTFSHMAAIAQDLTEKDGFTVDLWDQTPQGKYTNLKNRGDRSVPPERAAFILLDKYLIEDQVPCMIRVKSNPSAYGHNVVVVGVHATPLVINGEYFRRYSIKDPLEPSFGIKTESRDGLISKWGVEDSLMSPNHPEYTPYLMLAIRKKTST